MDPDGSRRGELFACLQEVPPEPGDLSGFPAESGEMPLTGHEQINYIDRFVSELEIASAPAAPLSSSAESANDGQTTHSLNAVGRDSGIWRLTLRRLRGTAIEIGALAALSIAIAWGIGRQEAAPPAVRQRFAASPPKVRQVQTAMTPSSETDEATRGPEQNGDRGARATVDSPAYTPPPVSSDPDTLVKSARPAGEAPVAASDDSQDMRARAVTTTTLAVTTIEAPSVATPAAPEVAPAVNRESPSAASPGPLPESPASSPALAALLPPRGGDERVLTAPGGGEPGVRTLLTRFREAYGRLDAQAAKQVWPGVDERALSKAFSNLTSQEIAFDHCRIHMGDETALAYCDGSTTYVGRLGSQSRTRRLQWTFSLDREAGDWHIRNVEIR